MGRLIRCRTWDSNKKEMLTGDFIEDRHPEYRVSLAYGSLSVLVAATCLPLELMQFTGLYDRNGAEVYEGDVVDLKRRDDPNIYQVVVKDIRFLPEDFFGSGFEWSEVVGNIYSNPELLERP